MIFTKQFCGTVFKTQFFLMISVKNVLTYKMEHEESSRKDTFLLSLVQANHSRYEVETEVRKSKIKSKALKRGTDKEN